MTSFHGHFWTVQPHLRDVLFPPRPPRDEPWSTTLTDPQRGELRLTGWLRAAPEDRSCVVLLHGLGGSANSRYLVRMARAVASEGLAYLRLSVRGGDRSGEDIAHAALTADLHAALASPALASFDHLYVVGYSLGGHLALRWAVEEARDRRVRALACICSPLDLAVGARALQRPLGRPYQRHLMSGLKEVFRAVDLRQRPLPATRARVEAMRTLYEWDEELVAPRFGFDGHEDYYAKASAGPWLPRLAIPTLFVAAEADPMVTAAQLRPWLAEASEAVEVRWTAGGHVGFPPGLDLGVGRPGPVEPQVAAWLRAH